MPRSSRGSSSRSSSGPAPSAPGSSFGRRGASTVASPPPQQRAQPPAAQPQQHNTPSPVPQPAPSGGGGGFLSNVMGTAAGVGMGSVIGHGVSNALFGGSGSGHVQEAAPAPQEQQQSAFQQEQPTRCSIQAKDFTQCLTATNNDVTACQFYLDQLKACQQMASQY